MKTTNKFIVGFLTLLILSGVVYVTLPSQNVRIRVDNDKTTFYVKLLDEKGEPKGNWLVSGREYNKLMDGTANMNRKSDEVTVGTYIDKDTQEITITRRTKYIRGPVIVDTYKFFGDLDTVGTFPMSHTVDIYNASGKFYRYEVRDLDYDGDTFRIEGNITTYSFGKNMKVEWWKDYNFGWIYKSGSMYIKSEKLKSNHVKFNMRLFDPKPKPEEILYYWNETKQNQTIFPVYCDRELQCEKGEICKFQYKNKTHYKEVNMICSYNSTLSYYNVTMSKITGEVKWGKNLFKNDKWWNIVCGDKIVRHSCIKGKGLCSYGTCDYRTDGSYVVDVIETKTVTRDLYGSKDYKGELESIK